MPQRHGQHGMFNITTNAKDNFHWCTQDGVPQILIDNLAMTRDMQKAKIYAFCVLPNHMHIIMSPGESGLSTFMQSFKSNGMKDIKEYMRSQLDVTIHSQPGRGVPAAGNVSWQSGFHDERIRDGRQCANAMAYVQGNAMHHGLVDDILKWPWSSLHFPQLLDEMEMWMD